VKRHSSTNFALTQTSLQYKLWCVTFWANRSFTAFVLLALSRYLRLVGHLQAYRLLGSSSPCICTQVSWQRECHENLSIQNQRICCDYTVSGLALYAHRQLSLQLLLPHSYCSLHQHIEALELVFVIGWRRRWRLLWVREVTALLLLTGWSSRNFTTQWCVPEVCSRTHCWNLCLGRCILSETQIIRPITNCVFCFLHSSHKRAWVKRAG